MKKVFVLACAALLISVSALAQETEKPAKNFGPYQTNKFFDNWFIGLAGGANISIDRVKVDGVANTLSGAGAALDVNVGKWFDPRFGFRIGYQGLTTKMKDGDLDNKLSFNYIHADLLWNISNQFWGYKEDRVYNAIPYFHAGYLGDIVRKDEVKHGQEFGLGLGFQNNFRLAKRLALYVDIRGMLTRGEQFRTYTNNVAGNIAVLAGLQVNLGKTNWDNADGDPEKLNALEEANKALQAAKDALQGQNDALQADKDALAADKAALQDQNKDLADQVEALKNNPGSIIEKITDHMISGPMILYFDLGKASLNDMEHRHLTYYIENSLKADKDCKFILTGTADKGTGSQEVNEKLCAGRVDYVKNVLINEYKVKEENIVVNESVIADFDEHPEFGRSVIIEH